MRRALRAREVDLCVASQPILGDGLDSVHLYDEPVWLAAPPDHRLASRASVSVAELREEPFVISRPGHWQRRLLDRLLRRPQSDPAHRLRGRRAGRPRRPGQRRHRPHPHPGHGPRCRHQRTGCLDRH
ncbi:LysR family transcriptional regulator substrate-binding protein [Streptomyces sp. NPDC005480]|uniref:LysR family transcriptional regulator substrate-binding protein n=1 Tax=Streptomyces sp. NPDC005480 TaxID=3154880 RepID=UPI0033A8D695